MKDVQPMVGRELIVKADVAGMDDREIDRLGDDMQYDVDLALDALARRLDEKYGASLLIDGELHWTG